MFLLSLLFLNLGGGEVIVIVLVILMFFGAKNIPDLARGLGKGLRELRDATNNIQREIEDSARISTKEEDEIKKDNSN